MESMLYMYLGYLFLLIITDTFSIVFYSGNEKTNYYDANTTCQNVSGELLQYGMVFVSAMSKCQPSVYAWTGVPFYRQSEGCYRGNSSKQTPSNMEQDIRVAVCADFCIDTKYTHFGMTTTGCHCFTPDDYSNLVHSNTCQIVSCPGNVYDICGVSPYVTLYHKVTDYDITSCRARVVTGNDQSHEFAGYCLDLLPFLCKVGESDDIICSLQNPETTTESSSSVSDVTTVYSDTTSDALTDNTVSNTESSAVFEGDVGSTESTGTVYDTTFANTGATLEKHTKSTALTDSQSPEADKSTTFAPTSSHLTTTKSNGIEEHTTRDFIVVDVSTTNTLSSVSTAQSEYRTISTSSDHEHRTSSGTDKMIQTTHTIVYEFTTGIDSSSTEQTRRVHESDMTSVTTTRTYEATQLKDVNKQAIIIGLSVTIAILVILLLLIFAWKVRKKSSKPTNTAGNHSVCFVNSEEEDTNIYYSSLRFNNLYDFSRSSTINPFKLKEPMYDEEILVYNEPVLDE